MERKALHAPLAPAGLDDDTPGRCVDVDVLTHALAVVADGVDGAAHVVHEETTCARLVDERHHPRCQAVHVGNDRNLAKATCDRAFGRMNGRGERKVRGLLVQWRSREQSYGEK